MPIQKFTSQQVVIANLQAPHGIVPIWQNETGLYYAGGASATPWNRLRIDQDPTQVFIDTFDANLDTNQWTPTNAGGGVIPTYTTASVTLSSGTTANGYSKLATIPNFGAEEPAWLYFATRINIEFPVLTTGYRFWGLATTPGSPTIAAPLTDAVGFEIGTNGKLVAVTYAAGVRLAIQDLSVSTGNGSQPADSAAHKYFIFFRPDICYWCIDSIDNVVAQFITGASGPNVNNLPMTYLAVSNGTPAVTIVLNGCSIGDTGRNNLTLSDSTYAWREIKILTGGELLSNNAQAAYPNAPTNVASSASDVAITAANLNRRMLIVSNDSTSKLYLLVDPSGAGTSSPTNFTYVVAAGATFEFPNPVSTARVRGIWSAANGTAAVTDVSQTPTIGGS